MIFASSSDTTRSMMEREDMMSSSSSTLLLVRYIMRPGMNPVRSLFDDRLYCSSISTIAEERYTSGRESAYTTPIQVNTSADRANQYQLNAMKSKMSRRVIDLLPSFLSSIISLLFSV